MNARAYEPSWFISSSWYKILLIAPIALTVIWIYAIANIMHWLNFIHNATCNISSALPMPGEALDLSRGQTFKLSTLTFSNSWWAETMLIYVWCSGHSLKRCDASISENAHDRVPLYVRWCKLKYWPLDAYSSWPDDDMMSISICVL